MTGPRTRPNRRSRSVERRSPFGASRAPIRRKRRHRLEALAVGALASSPLRARARRARALGVVSSLGPQWRSLRGGVIDVLIQPDAALTRSSKVASALDAEGRALGMAVFGPRWRRRSIPLATIDRVVELLAIKAGSRADTGLGRSGQARRRRNGDGDQRRAEGQATRRASGRARSSSRGTASDPGVDHIVHALGPTASAKASG